MWTAFCLAAVGAASTGPICGLWTGRCLAAQPADPPAPPAPPAPVPAASMAAARLLRDSTADAAKRAAAARDLVTADDAPTRALVGDMLAAGSPPTDVQRILVGEIARTPVAPANLLDPLTSLLAEASAQDKAAILGAIGSIRTTKAVRVLIDHAGSAGDPAVRQAAFAALGRLTGRTDLGDDLGRWKKWFASVEWLDEPGWQRVLTRGLAAQVDRSARAADYATDRLVKEKRDRFRMIPTDDPTARTQYLAALLKDDMASLRRLGAELAIDELANARQPGPAVADAAVALLQDPQPQFRRLGADLIQKLAPPNAGPSMNDALIRENDPSVASPLLKAVARWPEQRCVSVAVRWLEHGPDTRAAALDAIVAADQAGLLTDRTQIQRILSIVRKMTIAELSPGAMRLLVRLGDDSDREQVADLLANAQASIKLAAAEALGSDPAGLRSLLKAAAHDDSLYKVAAQALARHRPDPRGLRALLSLPAPSDDAMRERVRAMGSLLRSRDLVRAARGENDLKIREALLSEVDLYLRTVLPLEDAKSARDASVPVSVSGVLMLADTRLALGDPAGALDALETLDPFADRIDKASLDAVRVVALVKLNRLDEAADLHAPLGAWLRALDGLDDTPQGRDAAAVIRSRFAGEMPPEVAARIKRILSRPKTADAGAGAAEAESGGP